MPTPEGRGLGKRNRRHRERTTNRHHERNDGPESNIRDLNLRRRNLRPAHRRKIDRVTYGITETRRNDRSASQDERPDRCNRQDCRCRRKSVIADKIDRIPDRVLHAAIQDRPAGQATAARHQITVCRSEDRHLSAVIDHRDANARCVDCANESSDERRADLIKTATADDVKRPTQRMHSARPDRTTADRGLQHKTGTAIKRSDILAGSSFDDLRIKIN